MPQSTPGKTEIVSACMIIHVLKYYLFCVVGFVKKRNAQKWTGKFHFASDCNFTWERNYKWLYCCVCVCVCVCVFVYIVIIIIVFLFITSVLYNVCSHIWTLDCLYWPGWVFSKCMLCLLCTRVLSVTVFWCVQWHHDSVR